MCSFSGTNASRAKIFVYSEYGWFVGGAESNIFDRISIAVQRAVGLIKLPLNE